ncbi:MAG: hypothetical protein KBD48_03050 [Candidatus Pacebacteria bacterium]|nr:hypothetical protein [Candidatus Paceibacterota bacterium]MBP9716137.1 hypothetical protein [Candidatus Paceibacterota bacterium]
MIKLFTALLVLVLGSCATTQKMGYEETSPEDIIFFNKHYRGMLTDRQILDRRDATFLNSEEIKLIGVPVVTKGVFFKDDYLIEGNWKLITLPVRTYGKAIRVSPGIILTQHSERDTVSFTWIERGDYYDLDSEKDEAPKVPRGIKDKYGIGKNHQYIEYLGGKFYIITGSDAKLEVHHKILDPDEIKLKGLRK